MLATERLSRSRTRETEYGFRSTSLSSSDGLDCRKPGAARRTSSVQLRSVRLLCQADRRLSRPERSRRRACRQKEARFRRPQKTGRATWREKVGQSGFSPGVARSIKKKQQNIATV